MLRTKIQQVRALLASIVVGLLVLMVAYHRMATHLHIHPAKQEMTYEYISQLIAIILAGILVSIACEHRLWRGSRYFIRHLQVKSALTQSLIDANYYIRRNQYSITLPKISVEFEPDLASGTVTIQNVIAIESKLDSTDISSGLRNYVVSASYMSADHNSYVYEILDSSIPLKLAFDSFDSFQDYCRDIPRYYLFIDSRTTIKLQSMLITGQTGSGKTYAVLGLILQLLMSERAPCIYIADPKLSSLAVAGMHITSNTATSISDIITLLESFVGDMNERKEAMSQTLVNSLDADYSYFKLEPRVFIFDEFASFMGTVNSMSKKDRDHVHDLIGQVILQGRQLGFFLFILMQKSDSNIINTAYRDNLPAKFVLGMAENTTYVTTFGAGVEIPQFKFSAGEGVFTEPSVAVSPTVCGFPTLQFDILDAMQRAVV